MQLFPWVSFILALIALPMVHISKYVHKDRKKTMMWMWIGVISTLGFLAWVLLDSGWD